MQDKILVVSTLLSALMVISMTVTPSPAFVYPDGSQDNKFEIFGPRIDKILIKKYAGLDPEMQALQAGEIDFTDCALTRTWVDTFALDPDVRVLGYGGEAGYYTFNFNHNNNPYLGNPEDPAHPNPRYSNPCSVVSLRQALTYLVDRSALAVDSGEGLYDPIFTPIPVYMAYWIHPDIRPGGALEPLTYPPSVLEAAAKLTANGFLTGGLGGKRYWDLNGNAVYDGASEDLNLIIYARIDKLRKDASDMLCAGLDDPTIQVAYTRYDVTAVQAWQKVMVEKDYHLYTAGWSYIGPDPDYLYDLYHWDNYYHPEDPPNFGAIGVNDPLLQEYSAGIKSASSMVEALTYCRLFQEQFAATACEIPLASISAPKAYSKWYTGGTNGVAKYPDDGENKYRGLAWTNVVNEKGQGVNSWYTTQDAYPEGYLHGDGSMIMRYGWKETDMPQTLNPMYSSWYWESEILSRVYNNLGGRDPMTKGQMEVPFLADYWSCGTWYDWYDNETKSKVTVIIRPDAMWSDGYPMDINDVIYTFIDLPKEIREKGCPDISWQPTIDRILSYYLLDQYTVEILFDVNTLWVANWVVGNVIIPKHIWQPYIATHTIAEISGDFSGQPAMLVGTGPFLYVENIPGTTVTMVANRITGGSIFQRLDKCINMYQPSAWEAFTVEAIPPSTQLSPLKIEDDGTGRAHVDITIPVTNLDQSHWEDFNKTVELVFPDDTIWVLAPEHNIILGPWGVHFETFTLDLPKGHYVVRVTIEITSGHNYDWVIANLPPSQWEHYLGPITVEKDFWITVTADINEDGIVDIFDLVLVALEFAKARFWGNYDWNPRADVNRDGRINIFDIVIVALDYAYSW